MAVNSVHHADVPIIGVARLTTANTDRDTIANDVSIVTGSANGSAIEYFTAHAAEDLAANGLVFVWYYDGTNNRLRYEFAMADVTASASVSEADGIWTPPKPIFVPSGKIIKVTFTLSKKLNVFAHGYNLG